MKKFILLAFVVLSTSAHTQPSQENKLQAAILYNIVKYFEWPTKNESGDLEIAVLGNDEIFEALKVGYEGRFVGNKKCVIKKISNAGDASTNSVIYIGKSKSKDFDFVKNMAANKSLLTITDKDDWGRKGSCINFVIVDGKLKFELNRAAIATSNLKVSWTLTSMAIII